MRERDGTLWRMQVGVRKLFTAWSMCRRACNFTRKKLGPEDCMRRRFNRKPSVKVGQKRFDPFKKLLATFTSFLESLHNGLLLFEFWA